MLNIPYEVQQALRKGDMRKNYKMKVNDVDPDTGERTYLYTIDNDSLVSESVKIDERMVTGKVLKFGLCEGSSLEFQYFDHPNINGKDVQVYCSVEYIDGNGDVAWYDIPMGWYTVDQCPMQWDTGIFKVTAYNKLKSKYLDSNVKQEALSLIATGTAGHPNEIPVNILLNELLDGYSILTNYEGTDIGFSDMPAWAAQSVLVGMQVYPEDQSQYTSLPYYVYSCCYGIVINNLSLNDIYNVILKVKALKDYCYQKFKTYFDDYYVDSGKTTTIWDYVLNGQTGTKVIFSNAQILIDNQQWYDNEIVNDIFTSTDDIVSKLYTDVDADYYDSLSIIFRVPILMKTSSESTPTPWSQAEIDAAYLETKTDLTNMGYIDIRRLDSEIGNYRMVASDLTNVETLTMRELQSAVYELDCQYGQLDRETDLFTGVELNQGGLLPADNLYPANDLYPQGDMEHPFPSSYQKLWTDTVGEQSFRYLIITYKAMENGQEVEKTLQRTVNADGTTNYNMSDNWLFRNLVWTAADVGDYADAMVLKMKDIRWFPYEMWCAGLPYVETGDAIEITDKQGNTHTSYVLTRTLDGIHNLQDTFINGELDIF